MVRTKFVIAHVFIVTGISFTAVTFANGQDRINPETPVPILDNPSPPGLTLTETDNALVKEDPDTAEVSEDAITDGVGQGDFPDPEGAGLDDFHAMVAYSIDSCGPYSPTNAPSEVDGSGSDNSLFYNKPCFPLIGIGGSVVVRKPPKLDFATVDAGSNQANRIPLGPSTVTGFEFGFQGTWVDQDAQDIHGRFYYLSGNASSDFSQPGGTQQVVASVGGTGTPFGLNANTTFRTSYESYGMEIGARYRSLLYSNGGTSLEGAIGALGEYRHTDIDTDYTTSGGGQRFNNSLDISEQSFILTPTIGLTGYYRPVRLNNVQFDMGVEVGPSINFNRVGYADCGSTDGTGGVCNGGFFNSSTSANSVDTGLFASLTGGVTAKLNDRSSLRFWGSIRADQALKHDAPNSTATGLTWQGEPLYRGDTQVTYKTGFELLFPF